jgi:hypothetical protein
MHNCNNNADDWLQRQRSRFASGLSDPDNSERSLLAARCCHRGAMLPTPHEHMDHPLGYGNIITLLILG